MTQTTLEELFATNLLENFVEKRDIKQDELCLVYYLNQSGSKAQIFRVFYGNEHKSMIDAFFEMIDYYSNLLWKIKGNCRGGDGYFVIIHGVRCDKKFTTYDCRFID